MLKKLLLLFTLFSSLALSAQIPALDWAYAFGGSGNESIMWTDVDSQGNVVNIGHFQDTIDFDQGPGVSLGYADSGLFGMFVQKIDPSGNLLWNKTWTGPGNLGPEKVVIGPGGSIFICGTFQSSAIDFDPSQTASHYLSLGTYSKGAFVLKLDSQGNFMKVIGYGGNSFYFMGMKHDGAGSLYLAGNFSEPFDANPNPSQTNTISPNANGVFDFCIQKIDVSLNQVWFKAVYGVGNNRVWALALTPNNEPVVLGSYSGNLHTDPASPSSLVTASSNINGLMAKYSPSGTFISAGSTGGTGESRLVDIQIDRHGFTYLAGTYQNNVDFLPGTGTSYPIANNHEGWFIEKLKPNGNLAWVHPYRNSMMGYNELPLHLAVDKHKNVYSAGYYTRGDFKAEPAKTNGLTFPSINIYTRDIFMLRHDSTGAVQWGRGFGSSSQDRARCALVDANESFYISGYYSGTITFDPYSSGSRINRGAYDCYVLKFKGCPPAKDTTMAITACNFYKHNGIRYYSDTLLVDTLVSSSGCDSAIEKSIVTFYNLPLTVDQSPGTLSWVPGSGGNYTYAWYNCTTDSLVAGANLSFLKPQTNGTYALILSDGSCTDTSACFTLNDVGLAELNPLEFLTVYPNPVNEVLYISGSEDDVYDLTLSDISGRKVLECKKATSLDVSQLPAGTYFLRIEQGEYGVSRKIIRE